VVFLFDEFHILIKCNVLNQFLSTLKTYRDNRSKFHVVSCICFGTFKIMTMSDKQNSYSPFHVHQAIQMEPPSVELLRSTLDDYNSTLSGKMNKQVLASIVHLSKGHLGLFSLLGYTLHDKMASKGKYSFLTWLKLSSSNELYRQLRFSKPYQQIVDALQKNDLALYWFLRHQNSLFVQNSFHLPESAETFELQDVGLLEWNHGKYIWTSPIIQNFVINYCESQLGTFELPAPQIVQTTSKKIIDIVETVKQLVPFINLQSIIGLNPDTPREAAFHAEMYRLLAATLRNSLMRNYTVYFEGRVDRTSRRRFDLLIENDEKYVVEFKIQAHTNATLSDALTQVYEYGKALNAHQCFIIDFTDHQPTPNLLSQIKESQTQNLMVDIDDDAEYTPSSAPYADVHVMHFVYTNDWKTLSSCIVEM